MTDFTDKLDAYTIALWLDNKKAVVEARAAVVSLFDAERARAEAAEKQNAVWLEKASAWLATPEAWQQLQGYRELGKRAADAENERDAARAELARVRPYLQHNNGCGAENPYKHRYYGCTCGLDDALKAAT